MADMPLDQQPPPLDASVAAPPAAPDTVQVVNEDGELGTIPSTQLQDAMANGYQQATPEHIAAYQRNQKYGSTGQQLLTGLEGAGEAATFGLSTGAERMAGIKPEDIAGRREENPLSHMVGQGAGLLGSAALGNEFGAANILGKAGEAAVGLGEAATPLAKIGSAAVKSSIENMLFQSGDEVSKLLSNAPDSAETAATDIGLAGLIGGGVGGLFGAVSPLWEATEGAKVGGLLKAITDKTGGVDGASIIPDDMEHVIQTSGMNLAPEVRAGLSNDPQIQQMFSTLNQSDTTGSGVKLQEAFKKFQADAGDHLASTLGKTPGEVEGMEVSKYESGKKIGNTLADEYNEQISPLSKQFDAMKERTADKSLIPDQSITKPADYSNPYKPSPGQAVTTPGTVSKLADRIALKAQEEGWAALHDSDIMASVNKVLKSLPKQETLGDLGKLASAVGQEMQSDWTNGALVRAGGIIKGLIRDAESDVMAFHLKDQAPGALEEYSKMRAAYKAQAELKEALDSRLHAKGSTAGYAKSLREMANTDGERVIQRLSGGNDADLLNIIQKNYPKTAQAIKDYHIDNILKNAVDKAKGDNTINSSALIKSINKMSPELRSFVIPDEVLNKIHAVGTMLEQFNKVPHNFSNTARTMDKLMEHLPASAGGVAALLLGHNPATGYIAGQIGKWLGKDVPDAARLGLLKFLGSKEPIQPGAFKSMVDMIHSVSKGEALISNAAKNLFRAGKDVLPESAMPSSNDIQALDRRLKKLQANPEPLTRVASNVTTYMPEHGAAMGQTTARAVNYLNNLRPNTTPRAPLDARPTPSSTEKAQYDRALKIAQQPLLVLVKAKQGTLTPQDLIHTQNLYPNLLNRLRDKVTAEMTDSISKGNTVPYKTRVGLSMFMAQPLDSTLSPQGIMNAQPEMNQKPQESQPIKNKRGTSTLGKTNKSYQTPSQAAEKDRGARE